MAEQGEKPTSSTSQPDAPPPASRATELPRLNVFSPTLQGISRENWPANLTACMQCPSAIWMQTGTDLLCYCRVMYRTTWSKAQPTEILACDGATLGREEEAEG